MRAHWRRCAVAGVAHPCLPQARRGGVLAADIRIAKLCEPARRRGRRVGRAYGAGGLALSAVDLAGIVASRSDRLPLSWATPAARFAPDLPCRARRAGRRLHLRYPGQPSLARPGHPLGGPPGSFAKGFIMTIDTDADVLALRREATRLAGRPADLVQRASVYRHLFAHSGGNHAFPLLGAHGALWGSGYFRKGLRFGGVVASDGLRRRWRGTSCATPGARRGVSRDQSQGLR